jgi:hypothetical protein
MFGGDVCRWVALLFRQPGPHPGAVTGNWRYWPQPATAMVGVLKQGVVSGERIVTYSFVRHHTVGAVVNQPPNLAVLSCLIPKVRLTFLLAQEGKPTLKQDNSGLCSVYHICYVCQVAQSTCQHVSIGLWVSQSAPSHTRSGSCLWRASICMIFSTLRVEPPPANSDGSQCSTIFLASSGAITRAPMVKICALLLLRARSAE